MSKVSTKTKRLGSKLPLLVEKDEDGFYVVECPVFEGCYSQGKTKNEALKNIREVIELIIEDKGNKDLLKAYRSKELSLYTMSF